MGFWQFVGSGGPFGAAQCAVCACGGWHAASDAWQRRFLPCVCERYDVVFYACVARKNTFDWIASLCLLTHVLPIFSNIHRLLIHVLFYAWVPNCEVLTGVRCRKEIWGTRRLKLDCAVQHCLIVIKNNLASVRRRVVQEHKLRPGSMRSAQLGTMYSSITLIDSSPFIYRAGSTEGNVRAMLRAAMFSETTIAAVLVIVEHVGLWSAATAESLGVSDWNRH